MANLSSPPAAGASSISPPLLIQLLVRLAVALAAVAAAALGTWLLWDLLEPTITPLFLIAIAISGWVGGLRGGILAAGLSAIASIALCAQLEWRGQLGWASAIWGSSFLLVALLTGALNAARRRAEKLLIERDLRMRLISDQIPAGLWSTDCQLRLTSMFGAGLPMVSADTSGTMELSDVFGGSEHPTGRIAQAAHRRALTGKPASYELELGGRVYQSHLEPLHDAQGNVIGVVGVALDITARKRTEDRLRQAWNQAQHARQQAEAASQAKDRFLAMLSHELRTPLTPALLAAADLEQRQDLPPTIRQDLELIRRNIELEAVLIDDLLDLTRVSSGKLELNLRPVDLHAVIERAISICRPDVQQKQIDLRLELTAQRHLAMGDAARLQQVIWNLLKNAVKFTPANGWIAIRTHNLAESAAHAPDASPFIVIEISDSGIGIEPEVLPRIFQAFEQGQSWITRSFGGLGLGLAICRALVEAHGGAISGHSDGPGRGATFRVELPVASATEEAPPPPTTPPAPAGASTAARPLKILLVEDHPDTRRLMGRLLETLGYDIRTAGSMAAALQQAEIEPVELLVSDLDLPDGSGLELMRRLRARGGKGAIKGIALSGYAMQEDVRRCREAGFARHLTKPVNLRLLQETIQQVAGS